MWLKSPQVNEIVHVALTDGRAITIDDSGRDVPSDFVREALLNGAIPTDQHQETSADVEAKIAEEIKRMLSDSPDSFTAAGLPNRKTLSARIGFAVNADQVDAAMAKLSAEAA